MGHRRLQRLAKTQHLPKCALATDACIDRNAPALVQDGGDSVQFRIAGTNDRARDVPAVGGPVLHLHGANVAGYDQDRHAALGECCLGGQGGEPPRLAGIGEQLAKYAAAAIDRLEVDLLREIDTQFIAVDLTGNQYHRSAIAMTFEEAVDEMETAGTATPGAGGESARHIGLGAGGESARLLVAHVHPVYVAASNRVGDMVQGVAHHAVAPLHSGNLQCVDNDISDFSLSHEMPP